MSNTIKWFKELTIKDVPLVGGKNASLGEMIRTLSSKGVRVPDGFAITAKAYRLFLKESGLAKEIRKVLKDLNTKDIQNLQERGKKVREMIINAELPRELSKEVIAYYRKLDAQYSRSMDHGSRNNKKKKVVPSSKLRDPRLSVAVRSSATAEDLPDASFAGQQETFLNVVGEKALLDAVKRCFASLFTDRAISYRHDKKFDQFKVYLSVGVQKMIRSDKGSSGVMFSIDTESGFKNVVLINSIYGLGENIVQGRANPDEFLVFKPTLEQGYNAIIKKTLGDKKVRMVYKDVAGGGTINIAVPKEDQMKYSLTDKEALELARYAVIVEQHYKKPMDMEWARDGVDKKLYMIQARPETVESRKDVLELEEYMLKEKGKVLVSGIPVGEKIGQGKVRVIMDPKKIKDFQKGEVLVTRITDPDWEPIMKIASAIVTDSGGRTSHAAIVSRELGIPAVVGSKNATTTLKTGQEVTVSCSEGLQGKVYQGLLKFAVKKTNLKGLKSPKSDILMNVAEPSEALKLSFLPNKGVGLAREELIINDYIKAHPMALLNFAKLKDKKAAAQIEKLAHGYATKTEYYVQELAEGVGQIAAAFYPKPVIVRLADFRSNEFRQLIGGAEFEPVEENPMIGWRGASRYYDPKYRPAFDLECQALRHVRDVMGLKNLIVMVPFCRTVDEGRKVLEILFENKLIPKARVEKAYHHHGTRNMEHGTKKNKLQEALRVYVMVEIPSNVILAEQFAEIFDGFSIGSNDLTQLTLGIDRDAGTLNVAGMSNEKNDAVKWLISHVIHVAHKTGTKIGICGQAPSDFPDFAEFLLKEGIDSISLNPDTVVKTTQVLTK